MGQASSLEARRREQGPVMTWGDNVEWAIAAIPFVGMSALPVLVNLAVTGWDLSRVSWAVWVLSAWLFIVSVGGFGRRWPTAIGRLARRNDRTTRVCNRWRRPRDSGSGTAVAGEGDVSDGERGTSRPIDTRSDRLEWVEARTL
jgi:hypothetical protein